MLSADLQRTVIFKALTLAPISFLPAVLLAQPIASFLGNLLGQSILQAGIDVTVSLTPILLWIVLVLLLAAVSALQPARHAAQLEIRDAVDYS